VAAFSVTIEWMHTFSLLALMLALGMPAGADWIPVGPPGGDARSLAFDPKRPNVVFAGTSDGVAYRSDDGAATWQRLEPGFPHRGHSLDEMIVDTQGRLLVAYWEVAGPGGGVARSEDGGRTFTLLPIAGESVRALAVAPGRPELLVAGSLTGVFRSEDGGDTWQRISPAGHLDLRNIESVAIDPRDPQVYYAGTWHLPWKTYDGGRTWRPIKAGMIDDSDVFTMTVDRRQPDTIYGTACSGIYRSRNAGGLWAKIKGIPSSSRRTRAFVQHPAYPEVFFAGTTEGLWRSDDDLATWRLVTRKDLVVNSIAVLPGGAILAGCDGAGIIRSADRGESWTSSNDGFSERFISRVLFDPAGDRMLAAIREDRRHGGVLAAPVTGGSWAPVAPGLEGREVFALTVLGRGLFAGTDDGVFRLPPGGDRWTRGVVMSNGIELHPRITDIAVTPPASVYAASSHGLLKSADGGQTWERLLLGLGGAVDLVATARKGGVFAATRLALFHSSDGTTFQAMSSLPAPVHRLLVTEAEGLLLAATTEGLFHASEGGRHWHLARGGLPNTDIAALESMNGGRTLIVSDFRHGGLYRTDDGGRTWREIPSRGLRSNRLWMLAADPRDPDQLLGAASTGGLHRLAAPTASASSGSSAAAP
jgi:photosystem II stability/assembly factor-like uncharacterized protein